MGSFVKDILRHSSGRCSFRQVIPEALRPFCEGKREHKVSIGREGEPDFLSRYEAAKAQYDAMIKRAQKLRNVACCRFDGHRDRVFPPIGGPQCKGGNSAASSSLRR